MNRNIGECSRWDITFGLEDFDHDPSVDPMAALIEEVTKYLESCGRKANAILNYFPPPPNTPIEELYCIVKDESTKSIVYTLESSSKDRLVFKDGRLTGVIVYKKDTADNDLLYSLDSPVHKLTEAEDLVDVINHPSHYTSYKGIEVIQLTEQMNFNRGNAVKYIARAGLKNKHTEIEDLKKANWYIIREINRIKENNE